MKYVIWILVAALLIAHQDNWNWNDDTMFFGFIPIGLLYHICLSLAAGMVWFLACVFAWPKELEDSEVVENEFIGKDGAGKGGQAS